MGNTVENEQTSGVIFDETESEYMLINTGRLVDDNGSTEASNNITSFESDALEKRRLDFTSFMEKQRKLTTLCLKKYSKVGRKAVEKWKLNTKRLGNNNANDLQLDVDGNQENVAKTLQNSRIMKVIKHMLSFRKSFASVIIFLIILNTILYSYAVSGSGPIGVIDISAVSLCSPQLYDSLKYSILAFGGRSTPSFGNVAAACDHLQKQQQTFDLQKQQQSQQTFWRRTFHEEPDRESMKLCQRYKLLHKINYNFENYYLSHNGQQLIYDNRHPNHNLRKVYRYDLDSFPVLFQYQGKEFTLIDVNRDKLTFDFNDGAIRVAITFKNIFNQKRESWDFWNADGKNHFHANFNEIEDFVIEELLYSEIGDEPNRNEFKNFMASCVANSDVCNFENNQIFPLMFLQKQKILFK